ncbi:MAG: DUF3822 family protein [Chitinophagaceae bacterium]|nr:MAG: DUF3822 family protein [Chitinophagaceae bacterium]
MSNNSILLIDPSFEPANSTNLSLLVKIGTDTFSYAIIDSERKFVHVVYDEQECESGYEKLKERLKIDSYLRLAYANVKVATHTQNIIFVPKELFNENDVPLYTKFFADVDSENVYVQPSLQQSIHTIFSLPHSVEKVIQENWSNSVKMQQNAGLIELTAKINTNSLIIDFTVGSFQLFYIKDEKIAFTQSYQFEDVEEFTYYLLLIVSQLNINVKEINIKTCGIIHEGDAKWNLLIQYFNKVDFLAISSNLDTNILDDMPAHYYTSLLSLLQCG